MSPLRTVLTEIRSHLRADTALAAYPVHIGLTTKNEKQFLLLTIGDGTVEPPSSGLNPINDSGDVFRFSLEVFIVGLAERGDAYVEALDVAHVI